MEIHPTALVDPKAELGQGVKVGPFAIIERDVVIGADSEIGAYARIDSYTTMGRGCRIFPYASIGSAPQDLKFKGEKSELIIGDGTAIREYATVNRGTEAGGGVTRIGENCFLMAYTHVAHDCLLGKNVIMTNAATLAGHVVLSDHVIVGGLTAVLQFVKVGENAFLAGMSGIAKDIPPFVFASGNTAVLYGLNQIGLKRHGFAEEEISALKKAYRIVFRSHLTKAEALKQARVEVPQLPRVMYFLQFIETSQKGVPRHGSGEK
ncbi:MAG: acyl-ACP--UDP-N-acetylglucosamine O-acyltransferase [Deltaproteobacteria bacterium]|nr:acyl-ACP--UDP-N-acetylglucosamine O-acyltransferase [Deltaproteobacteria bacterium]